ncbi:hypothetical protein DBT54_10135 [Aerococcus loyolae]|uniref:Uncharacterized protein n=1 Tax=Aerococcus urinae TaxID=1376 RepID=A0A329NTY0_9LACT|nr:hypothetical protein DBT54_10135 [Aerococcus loyolae]
MPDDVIRHQREDAVDILSAPGFDQRAEVTEIIGHAFFPAFISRRVHEYMRAKNDQQKSAFYPCAASI